eukprot:595169-Pyramimonas_sp.AAC.3
MLAVVVTTEEPFLTLETFLHPESPEHPALFTAQEAYSAYMRQQRTDARTRECERLRAEEFKPQWFLTKVTSLFAELKVTKALCRQEQSPLLSPCLSSAALRALRPARLDGDLRSDVAEVALACAERRLNASQTEAVTRACGCQTGVCLIQGPPGTGKTSTIVTMLLAMAEIQGRSVLVTAPTNVAVGNIVVKLLGQLTGGPGSGDAFPPRPPPSDGEPDVAFSGPAGICGERLRLGDLVLVGSEDNIDLSGPLDLVFLESRIQWAEECAARWAVATRAAAVAVGAVVEVTRSGSDTAMVDTTVKTEGEEVEEGTAASLRSAQPPPAWEALWADCVSVGHELWWGLPTSMAGTVLELMSSAESRLSPHAPHLAAIAALRGDWRPLRPELAEALRSLTDASGRLSQKLRGQGAQMFLGEARVVFSTIASADKSMLVRALTAGEKVRTLVVDEAAQAPEAHTLMCLQPFVEHAVLVGDPEQLGGVVLSKLCAAHHFGRSLFERLQSIGHTACLLSEQYRMHPAISAWPSATFYGGRVVDGVTAEQRVIRRPLNGFMSRTYI